MKKQTNSSLQSNTIFVRNLPFATTNDQLLELFSSYGPIRRSFLVIKDGINVGYGYVKFASIDDAIRSTKDEIFLEGRCLKVDFADPKFLVRSKQTKKKSTETEHESELQQNNELEVTDGADVKPEQLEATWEHLVVEFGCSSASNMVDRPSADALLEFFNSLIDERWIGSFRFPLSKGELLRGRIREATDDDGFPAGCVGLVQLKRRNFSARSAKRLNGSNFNGLHLTVYQFPRWKDSLKCERKQLAAEKAAAKTDSPTSNRLIVRNLSFKTTPAELSQLFSTVGTVTESKLPLKAKNGKEIAAGFGFVSLETAESAQHAIDQLNGRKLHGRPVAIDYALPQLLYLENVKKEAFERADKTLKRKQQAEAEHDKVPSKKTKPTSSETFSSDDAADGQTAFLRNLAAGHNDQVLRDRLSEFGPILFCRICVDAVTGRSRDVAFVKFRFKEALDRLLTASGCDPSDEQSSGQLEVAGSTVVISRALTRQQIAKISEERQSCRSKKGPNLDGASATGSRNLGFAKIGFVKVRKRHDQTTNSTDDISKNDLERRKRLQQQKERKLRDPNYMVSATRLSIHNIPKRLSDDELRQICLREAAKAADGSRPQITECRIQRDLPKKSGASRAERLAAPSRGFGFVAFTNHQDALNCLKQLNNNPNYFSPEKRLIIEFSVESKAALRLKKQRALAPQKKPFVVPEKKASHLKKKTKRKVEAKTKSMRGAAVKKPSQKVRKNAKKK